MNFGGFELRVLEHSILSRLQELAGGALAFHPQEDESLRLSLVKIRGSIDQRVRDCRTRGAVDNPHNRAVAGGRVCLHCGCPARSSARYDGSRDLRDRR
jgi:hypothetical protein